MEFCKRLSIAILIFLLMFLLSFSIVCTAVTKPAKDKPSVTMGLVKLTDLDKSFTMDLRYATKNNFTGRVLYPKAIALLNINTAYKLINANNYLKKYGYHIKIFDAYRPHYVQELMWKLCSDKRYLADPKKGSNHNRGAAVDITMVDKDNKEVLMTSGFDEFSERAHINYAKAQKKALQNRELLAKAMVLSGFKRIKTEWWHFDDINYKKYPILNIDLSKFK